MNPTDPQNPKEPVNPLDSLARATDLSAQHPTRADRVVSWIGWHLGEFTGVLAPTALALVWTPWTLVVSGLVTAGWVTYEVRLARRHAAIRAGRDPIARALAAANPAVANPVLASTEPDGESGSPDPAAGWGVRDGLA